MLPFLYALSLIHASFSLCPFPYSCFLLSLIPISFVEPYHILKVVLVYAHSSLDLHLMQSPPHTTLGGQKVAPACPPSTLPLPKLCESLPPSHFPSQKYVNLYLYTNFHNGLQRPSLHVLHFPQSFQATMWLWESTDTRTPLRARVDSGFLCNLALNFYGSIRYGDDKF